jgi:hypothetical protein
MNLSYVLIIGIIIGLLIRKEKEKKDTYQSLEGRGLEESLSVLKELSYYAKLKLPAFPDIPKIWLEPPTNKGKYDSIEKDIV